MRRRRDEELYGAFDEQEDELSLEAILAEYGKGGRQPVPTEEAAIPEGPPAQPEKAPFLNRRPYRRLSRRPGPEEERVPEIRNTSPPRRIGWR